MRAKEEEERIRRDLAAIRKCKCRRLRYAGGKAIKITRSLDCPLHRHLAVSGTVANSATVQTEE